MEELDDGDEDGELLDLGGLGRVAEVNKVEQAVLSGRVTSGFQVAPWPLAAGGAALSSAGPGGLRDGQAQPLAPIPAAACERLLGLAHGTVAPMGLVKVPSPSVAVTVAVTRTIVPIAFGTEAERFEWLENVRPGRAPAASYRERFTRRTPRRGGRDAAAPPPPVTPKHPNGNDTAQQDDPHRPERTPCFVCEEWATSDCGRCRNAAWRDA